MLNLAFRPGGSNSAGSKLPEDESALLVQWVEKIRRDQPLSTPADSFSAFNYGLISYQKAALWLEELERIMGSSAFDTGIREYVKKWNGKHPQPAHLEAILKTASDSFPDNYFSLLKSRGSYYKQ